MSSEKQRILAEIRIFFTIQLEYILISGRDKIIVKYNQRLFIIDR